jgi:AcrR family transcriptional regulator
MTTPDDVKRNILEIATLEFAEKGYNGARMDEIADRTETSKRMIYYYYKDKEHLFIAVLEAAYAQIRAHEAKLNLEGLDPIAAMEKLISSTFDYHNQYPIFNRLVMIENIQQGKHIQQSDKFIEVNMTVIARINNIYERGVKSGVFRKGLLPIEIHKSMSALAFFNVSNRHTFSHIFKHDMVSKEALIARKAVVIETIMRYVRA